MRRNGNQLGQSLPLFGPICALIDMRHWCDRTGCDRDGTAVGWKHRVANANVSINIIKSNMDRVFPSGPLEMGYEHCRYLGERERRCEECDRYRALQPQVALESSSWSECENLSLLCSLRVSSQPPCSQEFIQSPQTQCFIDEYWYMIVSSIPCL